MKKIIVTIWVAILVTCHTQAQPVTVATFNMRYSIPTESEIAKDSINGIQWQERGPVIASMVRFHDMDIVGTQECLFHQLEDLTKWLPGFGYEGVGREDGIKTGEFNAILYRKDRFKILNKGTFWLSETPDKPSLGWDASCCNRICTWVYLEDLKTKKRFYFFNTHFDYEGKKATKESGKLVISKIKEIAGSNPAVLLGDLNGGRESEWYKTIAESQVLTDSYSQAADPYANNGSMNLFGKKDPSKIVIDHVFTTAHFKITKWGILTDSYLGKYPSDHFPVMVKFEIK